MNTIPDMVCWYEGMAMLPQHFQLQALRHETQATALAQYANPWFWGVNHLDIDAAALCAGQLRVLRLSAVMPDGTPIDYDISRDPALEFDCATLLPAAPDSAHRLWLALGPRSRAGQWQRLDDRCRSVNSEPLADLSSGEFPESMPLWRPAPRLVSQHQRADLICLPLLEVVYTEGGFRLSDWFPPMPTVHDQSYLSRQLRQLCRQAREKVAFLSRERHLAHHSHRTQEWLALSLALQSIQAPLPLLESLVNDGKSHPQQLWRALCLYIGQTATLVPDKTLPLLPPFEYANMLPGFTTLFSLLQKQLAHIQQRRERILFQRVENHFELALPPAQVNAGTVVIGVMMADGDAVAAGSWLERSLIASQSFISVLRRQRMRGMTVTPLAPDQRDEWETDARIALFTLTLTPLWLDATAPLVIAPLREGDVLPHQIMLYCQECHHDIPDA